MTLTSTNLMDPAPPQPPHRAPALPALVRIGQLLGRHHAGQHLPAIRALLEPHLVGVRALPEVETVIPVGVVARLLTLLPSSLALAIVESVAPWLPTAAAPTPVETAPAAARVEPVRLTDRELEVLVRIGSGLTNAQIGRQIYLSEETVKTHVRRLLRKLGARDRAHAVALGFRLGVLR